MSLQFFVPTNGYISEYFAECASKTKPDPVHSSPVTIELTDAERDELTSEAGSIGLEAYIHMILFDIDPGPGD